MEHFDRTKTTDLRWLLALGAAVGTFLLVFVPGDWWLNGAKTSGETLTAILAKQFLTVSLLLIVPALWARLAQRVSPWTLILLAAAAYGFGYLFSRDTLSAVYAAAPVVLPGLGLYALQRLRLSNFRTVLYSTFLILAGLFVCACLPDLVREGDAYRSARRILSLYEETLAGFELQYAELGGAELFATAMDTVRAFKPNAETLAVPVLLSASMAAGLSNTLFSHLFNRRGGAVLNDLPRFEDWRCERWYVSLAALFSITTFLLSLFGMSSAEPLFTVAEVLWRMPCALAGLCVVRKLGVASHRGWIFWIAIAMLLTLPPIALMILAVVGMFASWKPSMKNGEDGIR